MVLDFREIETRVKEVARLVNRELRDPHPRWGELVSCVQGFSPEEKLFFLFLATHFDDRGTAQRLHERLPWDKFVYLPVSDIMRIFENFFQEPRKIGDHRRYLMAMKPSRRRDYTVEVLKAYREAVNQCGSQAEFFEIDKNPDFASLYKRMGERIQPFHTRLPRFDHLERLARTHGFYVVPDRFYADDATGPRDGLTLLIVGQRYRRNRGQLTPYLTQELQRQWNATVDPEYRIPSRPTLKQVIVALELWVIDRVRKELASDVRNHPAYVFALESWLCEWQKHK